MCDGLVYCVDVSNVNQDRVSLRDFVDFEVMERVFRDFFDDTPPARTTLPCSDHPERIGMDLIAVAGTHSSMMARSDD